MTVWADDLRSFIGRSRVLLSNGTQDEEATINSIDTTQITEIKKDFTYRGEIQDICKEWKKKNFGDTSLISMHVRRGDFTDIQSGMFLIDDDYYVDALKQLPELPVLIFTNDKDYILNNKLWQSDRFTLITDLTNDNNCLLYTSDAADEG